MVNDEKRQLDKISIIAIILSALSLGLHFLNYYQTWHVPERAELSIICDSFSYDIDEWHLSINISGVATNEGARSTTIKEIELHYSFPRQDASLVVFTSTIDATLPKVSFAKMHLTAKEATSFTITSYLSTYTISEHGAIPEAFSKLALTIIHDDGLGLLRSSRDVF